MKRRSSKKIIAAPNWSDGHTLAMVTNSPFAMWRELMINKKVWWMDGEVTHVAVRDHLAARSPVAWRTLCFMDADHARISQLVFKDGKTTCLGCIANEANAGACVGAYVDFQGVPRTCLAGGEGCALPGCPGAHGPMGGW